MCLVVLIGIIMVSKIILRKNVYIVEYLSGKSIGYSLCVNLCNFFFMC